MQENNTTIDPFRVTDSLKPTASRFLNSGLAAVLEHLSGLRGIEAIYARIAHIEEPTAFLEAVLLELGVEAGMDSAGSTSIPLNGGVVIVANHPFGCIEGIVLARLLLSLRPDVKVLANFHLQRIPQLRDLFIGVDPFAGDGAVQRNVKPMRQALRWLREGGALVVFPAGAISHWHLSRRGVVDPPWSPSIGRLLRQADVPVLPVYFPGQNSGLFQVAGLVDPRLRTLLIPHELLNKRNRKINVRVGQLIPEKRVKSYDCDADLIAHLRLTIYMLADAEHRLPVYRTLLDFTPPTVNAIDEEPVAAAIDAGILAAEIAALPSERYLLGLGNLSVYVVQSEEILWVLREIGRLRELTFRAAGEGTGKARDLDLFDAYYRHLFIWDDKAKCIVGAYRLGLTDEILDRFGTKGLYTHSLFKFKPSVQRAFTPGLELGRSFIRQEYQRSFSPLLLLWKGIAGFVARYPKYRLLFGPVSISREYSAVSKQLMVDYLTTHTFEKTLARYVKPRHPFRRQSSNYWQASDLKALRDIEQLSELIAGLERDHKGVPILLKQYLKLGGRLLGFNVDNQFSDVVDGLILVDLCATDPKVLSRYMGDEAMAEFLAFHRVQTVMAKAS